MDWMEKGYRLWKVVGFGFIIKVESTEFTDRMIALGETEVKFIRI